MKMLFSLLFACLACICVTGCGEKQATQVEINSAPQVLKRDEWAVLCITQWYRDGEPLVELNYHALEAVAAYGLLIDTRQTRGNQYVRVQVIRVRPIGRTSLTFTADLFLNAQHVRPWVVRTIKWADNEVTGPGKGTD
jgi:hypothetical protein